MKYIYNMCKCVAIALPLWGLGACADHWDDFTPAEEPTEEVQQGIGFSAVVRSSQVASATRADGSIVNLHEYDLPETKTRTYWRADETGARGERKQTFYAGLFGCYTGQHTWAELVTSANLSAAEVAALSDDAKEERTRMLKDHYSANLLYNVKANIAPADGHRNALTYSPLRFWPNQRLESGENAGKHEYCTFWAYYPYNETSSTGEYGISLSGLEQGEGMDTVHFTMHPDAALQNDFMISAPVVDCNSDAYPLAEDGTGGYTSTPVPFTFFHMLAQVRIYAFIRGTDKMVYQKDGEGKDRLADATWFDTWVVGETIKDSWGNVYTKRGADQVEQTTQKESFGEEEFPDLTKEEFLAKGLKVPDESQTVRWSRTGIWDVQHTRRRANVVYSLSLNNINTSADFYPVYAPDGSVTIGHTQASTLGSATVNHYIMNPYWFAFHNGERERLDDDYMYGFFEDQAAYKASAGTPWKYDKADPSKVYTQSDILSYLSYVTEGGTDLLADQEKELREDVALDKAATRHYNFFPGNIIMAVPQTLDDDNVPHIVLTATDMENKDASGNPLTARLTINLLSMEQTWDSGFIYSYAFLDNDLCPGDDKVRGPESITVVVDTSHYTDQW